MHEKAFQGLTILIFGQRPLTPMRIEQTIANAAPDLEAGLESFEDYHQALGHARSTKRCGLILALDGLSTLPLADVVGNLMQPWTEATGLPCYSILVATGAKTLTGFEVMARDKRVLDYIGLSDLLDSSTAGTRILGIWHDYVSRLERDLLPDPHQEWLIALAEDHGMTLDSLHFCQRAAHFFRGKANIGWMESLALPWFPVTDALSAYQRRLGSKAGGLFALAESLSTLDPTSIKGDLRTLAKTTCSTGAKVKATIRLLDTWRKQGSLEAELEAAAQRCKPFDPAILRATVNDRDRIIEFASDASHAALAHKAG